MTSETRAAWNQEIDRRSATRRIAAANEPLLSARLRTGTELLVIDVSSRGILVETTTRLLPGAHVDMNIVSGAGRMVVASRVVRAHIHSLSADGIRYRAAMAFDQVLDSVAVHPSSRCA